MNSFFETVIEVAVLSGLFYAGTKVGERQAIQRIGDGLKDEEIRQLREQLAALNAKNAWKP